MISLLVTEASMKNNFQLLKKVLSIHPPLYFWKDLYETKALINFGSEVNAMTPVYTAKLYVKI